MKQVVLTICSREKNEAKELLPAVERYLGTHVSLAKKVAQEEKKDLYILSGLYGIIPAEQEIPYYDYFLEQKAVDALTKKVVEQLKQFEIGEIDFYTKPNWDTYNQVIEKATSALGIQLNVVELG